ncbi:hypothetical protein HRG_009894 [Hirsutella rhossiliensis]|uniref:Uncharacterized protein n=1 Tax=Hirsutella rhossiliensis TaxID=111463 RepID=A0A9P8SED1_9HYPO|nr:uncharacterized protein HRG_09894 [Hirsutella rhossiliensis]KAH0958849.1 hypothetical protein HRG_09894 [Hirsutella rhossiliensis]
MACRRSRLKKMAATNNNEGGSRVKPDDAESRSANSRPAMADHRGRGRSNGSKNTAGISMLNPESDIWVPTSAQATSPNVQNAFVDATIFDLGNVKHDSSGLDNQAEESNGQQAHNGTADGAVLQNHGNVVTTPGGVEAKGTARRVPVKARANTIATAGAPGSGSGLFEQMTFNLLNKTLRNGDGWKAGTP